MKTVGQILWFAKAVFSITKYKLKRVSAVKIFSLSDKIQEIV
jgi:hypothetical protein